MKGRHISVSSRRRAKKAEALALTRQALSGYEPPRNWDRMIRAFMLWRPERHPWNVVADNVINAILKEA